MSGYQKHVEVLSRIAADILASGANCQVEYSTRDVPKLYAVFDYGSGPHEIVCAAPDFSLDVWHSPDGRAPVPVGTNISVADAIRIVRDDYFRAVSS